MNDRAGYWDPLAAVRASAGARLPWKETVTVLPPAETYLMGRWAERNWRNVPGPFYGGETDTCETGPEVAPRHVLCDENGQEFVFRQPREPAEVDRVLFAAWNDPFRQYGMDGDRHWTTQSVRAWWRERARLREWAVHFATAPSGSHHFRHGLVDLLSYLDGDLEAHLRGYLFWLEEGRAPTDSETLPDLDRAD
ncbi:ferredoxin [Streptomyces sp. NPDC059835]|uniref:ferredoxin n=1 Tax=Streptomyces sp. NPDC059835 TaxID=3346967 RepID=UPI00365783E8